MMGKHGGRNKKLIVYTMIALMQMQTILPVGIAAAAPKAAPPVVNIARPDANGLSHNKADTFNVGKEGLIFNNIANGTAKTVLGGELAANRNLGGTAAKTILQEVTGTGISKLNGAMEIAGKKANLIIANPNGISVNGAGFINVERATLVTGRPVFTNGKLGFDVTGGKVNIEGRGNGPLDNLNSADEANTYLPSKLDIMTRAAEINGELWAKEEIQVMTGANHIDYDTSERTAITGRGEKPAVALDVAALGGMYAGKISLIGTEKGLGMNMAGSLSAQKDMTITNDGKMTFIKSGTDQDVIDPDTHEVTGSDSTAISAGGNVTITSTGDVDNRGAVTAQRNLTVQAGGNLSNAGVLQAGASYTASDEEENPHFISDPAVFAITAGSITNTKDGQMTASKQVTISSAAAIVNDGYTYSGDTTAVTANGVISGQGTIGAKSSVTIKADKVTLNKDNIYTISDDGKIDNKTGVVVTEVNPDKPDVPDKPETEDRKAEDFTNPELPDVAGTTKPGETVQQNTISDTELGLAADANANGKYKPIIDHAANGVDLVQIAEVNDHGVSRNVYSDFNIKSSGLILNNATEYTKTELGGYIDRNFFLAGNGARVILNEVTSSQASALNGYLEVAGHKASVVIANANGISVNGLGFINTDNVILSTGKVNSWADGNINFSADKGNMVIHGDGLNGRNPKEMDIITHDLTVDRSELYGNELHISADGQLSNSSKVAGTENLMIAAGSMENKAGGFIESKKDMTVDVDGTLHQNQAALKSGGDETISAAKLTSEENSLISSAKDAKIQVNTSVTNDKSILLAGGNISINAADFSNADTALVNYGQNADMHITGTLTNDHASIRGDGAGTDTVITADTFSNRNQGALVTKGSTKITASNSLANTNANIYVNGHSDITAGVLMNSNTANLHTGGDAVMRVTTLQNSKASIDVKGNLMAEIGSLTNETSGVIGTGDSAVIETNNFANTSLGSLYITKDFSSTNTGDFLNEDGLIAIGGAGSIAAKNITNQNKAGLKQGAVINAAGDLTLTAAGTLLNRSSDIESEKNITIHAGDLQNKKEIFETSFHESHENVSYKIPHLNGPNYYDAMREFDRQMLTGVIDKETDDANIIASGHIEIHLDDTLDNEYSKINAGGNLDITAKNVNNKGYQGTIHYYDRGQDNHYWKYKKHKRFHIGCHWKYGTTVLPYFDHTMYDEEGENSERRSLLGATGQVTIKAENVVNKTYQAQEKVGGLPVNDEYVKFDSTNHIAGEVLDVANKKVDDEKSTYTTDYLAKEHVGTDVASKNEGVSDPSTAGKLADISALHINSKIYSMNGDPSAKYLIETNKKYADYHTFLSSDYLLERVKADPEKAGKRLGDGYFEQQLVIDQISKLTGRPYLSTYGSDLEQFKALMDAGTTAAQEMNLQVGVALTAEQIASLTSDIVWLVEEVVNGEKVLVPEVYLASVREEDLTHTGALIVGGEVEIYSKQNIQNIGTIRADGTVDLRGQNLANKGTVSGENLNVHADESITNIGSIQAKDDVSLKADTITNETITEKIQYNELHQTDIKNTGTITAGKNLTLNAKDSITNKGGVLAADGDLNLHAGQNLSIAAVANEKHAAVAYGSSSAEIHSIRNQQGLVSGKNVTMTAGKDVTIIGGIVTAGKDTRITAGGNVTMHAVKDLYSEESEVGSRGSSYYNHNKQADEAVKGTVIAGKEDITVRSGRDISLKGSSITSEAGKATLDAKNNIAIQNETETHERLHESHKESSGILSSKSTDIYDYSHVNAVVGSSVSAGSAEIHSGKDTTVKGSSIAADHDVTIQTGGDLSVESAEQTSVSEYQKTVKKSGLISGGGLGFTIGKEKQNDQYANQNTEQVGSTIGGLKGSVTMKAGKDAAIKGSSVIAKKDIAITGENVNIENTNSIYNAQEKHEYERSGLSVSVGGSAVKTAAEAVGHVERAHQVEDKRLAALHGYEAYDTVKENLKAIKEAVKNPSGNLSINVSLGSTKSRSESASTTVVSNGSQIKAEGDVAVTSTLKDISITGSHVEGHDVILHAKENLNITASENSNITKQDSKSSSASIGASLDVGGLQGITAGYGQSEGSVKENSTTYNESTVIAHKKLEFTSGKDMNIQGGKVSGGEVTGNVGGDLHLESKQDSNSYEGKNTSAGMTIDYALGSHKSGVGGGASAGSIDSRYSSVTDQSGIYAGSEGFDIHVGKNTDLKGAVIDSKAPAEKNTLSTGTLTWDDIGNKADYEAGGMGVNVNINNGADYNEKGVTPSIGMPAGDEAESTTKSAIAQGNIEIRDKENQKQDLSGLHRDTSNSLNKLGEIFDKERIEERQELANLFGKLAYNQVHDMKGTDEQKAMYHAVIGGIMSQLTSGDFLSGASAAAVNKLVMDEIKKAAGHDPAAMQWLSAALGAVVGEVVANNAQAGAGTASSATKNNDILRRPDELADMLFENGRAEEFCKAQGIPATQENIEKLKGDFAKFAEKHKEADAIIISYGIGGNNSIVYDLKTKESYMGKGLVFPDIVSIGVSISAIKIIPVYDYVDINSSKARQDIFKGKSLTISGYYGIGGGISLPVNSDYEGLVKMVIVGIGTPQAGIEVSDSDTAANQIDQMYDQAMENKYGSD